MECKSTTARRAIRQTRRALLCCSFMDLAKQLLRQGAAEPHPFHDSIFHAIALLRKLYAFAISPGCCQHG